MQQLINLPIRRVYINVLIKMEINNVFGNGNTR